ncbi:serine/arginine repetitive matrix protein 2 isoform X2 [Nematolebias whitei]|uniref:serine/arginine repetitive matrix protein 2 isoform X2 n=1 Tax=Nematolebias whitei TaxID=451745 RepID=UPI0018978BF8|nr:serine/arginine repetitive matrix protein 2 isoform X2 [Nematolebias whitei]
MVTKYQKRKNKTQGHSDSDSEVEGRVDGVKSWLSKSKCSTKNLSDDGSLKSSRYAVNVDAKEGKEWKLCQEVNSDDKEVETNRPVSVMSSLSYRKQSNLDSLGSKGESAATESSLTFQKSKFKPSDLHDETYSVSCWKTAQAQEDFSGRESVISEANSRARRGIDSRLSQIDKESFVSSSRPATNLSFISETRPGSSFGLSRQGFHRSTSRLEEGRSERLLYGSSPSSPCFSRRSRSRSPGSVSQPGSHMLLGRSSRLSDFDIAVDDSCSVAFTERSAYSPHSSTGRSVSMPPPQARSISDNYSVDDSDIKPVSHRNYLDPDLEKAINEVLSFKPIKFKRKSLEDSNDEEEKSQSNKDEGKALRDGDRTRPTSSLRCPEPDVDCRKPSRSASSCSKSNGKSKKKKKRSHSSESHSSGEKTRRRSSSKRRHKKSKKRNRSSSSSSDSESDSGSSSDASTISYRSSSSVKKAPARTASDPEEEEGQPLNRKDEKKRKKKVDSLVMKYLYRPDSD